MIDSLFAMLLRDEDFPITRKKNIAALYKDLYPHRFLQCDDPFGRNNTIMLLGDPSVSAETKWPTCTQPSKLLNIYQDSKQSSSAIEMKMSFYNQIEDKMIADYQKLMISKGIMKTYDDVIKNVPYIDVTPLLSLDDDPDNSPIYSLSKETIANIRPYGWCAFIPCFKNMTIRINKRRYINIETLNVNKTKKSITIKWADYSGRSHQWILHNLTTMTLTFNDTDGFDIDIKDEDLLVYENLVTDFISEMKWDKKHEQLWRDMFGLYDKTNYSVCTLNLKLDSAQLAISNGSDELTMIDDESMIESILNDINEKEHLIVPDITYIKRVKDTLKPFPLKIDIAETRPYEDVCKEIVNDYLADFITSYLKAIALINHEIYFNPGTMTSNEPDSKGRYTRVYGDIKIQSENEPITARPD